ncbi:enoyl-CoA hydratase-related protein [Echinicola sediminis]
MGNHVKIAFKDKLAIITLNRPEKRNALNAAMIDGLQDALDKVEGEKKAKVVILKAEGKVFCSGADLADIRKMQENSYEENLEDSQKLKALFQRIYTFPKVVIAQVQGHALAGGCGLVSVCDFAYTVPEAKLGYTEVRIGFVPAMVLVFLIRKIGEGKAKAMLLGGELIAGDQAAKVGLVNGVFEAGELEKRVLSVAEGLVLQNSGQSMALTKQMIAKVQGMPLEEALDYAAEMNARARESEDCKKGIAAFLEKKSIDW